MKSEVNPRILTLAGMILAAALIRLLPHPPNFAPIAAMALFGGAYFSNKKLAFIIPLAALFLTDAIIGFHYLMSAVYVSFALIVLIGISVKTINYKNVFLASVSASVSFFMLTNLAEWALGVMYPKTAAGLAMCFTAAVPFFHYTLIGDLFFVSAMFGAFELFRLRFPVLSKA
jgi:hypothetical protein